MIHNYMEFITKLHSAGFSGAVGGKDDGVFGLFRYGWGAEDENAPHWHTGDPDTDPWEWRVRVLNERDDIAYGKLFFRKAGYITRQWYPYFLAARRDGNTFDELYADGLYSREAKRVYETLTENGGLPVQSHHKRSHADGKKRYILFQNLHILPISSFVQSIII